MSSLPPVSPGSVPALTESAGNGSATFDLEGELERQMGFEDDPSRALPVQGEGAYEENYGGEGEYGGEEGGWDAYPENTFDPSVYTAHQDFQRAASRFVSPWAMMHLLQRML